MAIMYNSEYDISDKKSKLVQEMMESFSQHEESRRFIGTIQLKGKPEQLRL